LPIRHNRTTEEKNKKKLENGDGQGEGANYRPYIRVGDFGTTGRAHRILSAEGRIHHFFSDLEKDYYYYLTWQDDVLDIKEQYPLERAITMGIADTWGIKHPTDPKTGVPIVMTTDFLITALHDGEKKLFARSVKYQADLEKKRVCEKQTLEKLYWEEKQIDWKIITENSFDRNQSRNIQFLMQYYQDIVIEGLPDTFLTVLVEHLLHAEHQSLAQICGDVDTFLRMQKGKALRACYYYAAHKALPIQIANSWNTWRVNEMIDIQQLRKYWEEGWYGQAAAYGG
jgi:hypothetical protein